MRDDEILEIEDTTPAKKKTQKQNRQRGIIAALWANIFVRHISYMVVGFCLLLVIVFFSLKIGTQHGKTLPVPNFTGMTVNEALETATQNYLRIEVVDSVFDSKYPRGTVVKQIPESSVSVKKNRRILLTMNAQSLRKVNVPNVVGYSLRQAKAVLSVQGLQVGNLAYELDIANNMVLEQHYKNEIIEAGQSLAAGSKIDLVLGLSDSEQRTIIPSVVGLSVDAAKDQIIENSLNISFHYDKEINSYADSIAARIYRQVPSASTLTIWPLGTQVEVYLKEVEKPLKQ